MKIKLNKMDMKLYIIAVLLIIIVIESFIAVKVFENNEQLEQMQVEQINMLQTKE